MSAVGRQQLVSETTLAAIEARHNALESRIEAQDERIANLIENINALRGDKQRAQSAELAANPSRRARVTMPAAEPKPRAEFSEVMNGPVAVEQVL